jgi:hypothetical protein
MSIISSTLLMQCFERNFVVIVMKGKNWTEEELYSHNSLRPRLHYTGLLFIPD